VGGKKRENKTEDIEASQLARELTHKVYGLTKKTKLAHDFDWNG
jgi:hypothetical protein